jgi:hypothetical protein
LQNKEKNTLLSQKSRVSMIIFADLLTNNSLDQKGMIDLSLQKYTPLLLP